MSDGGALEWIISHVSMRRNCYFMDAADGVFSKDAITNKKINVYVCFFLLGRRPNRVIDKLQ